MDKEKIDEIYRENAAMIYKYLYGLTGDSGLAEELTQTGFALWGSHIFDHAQEFFLQMLLLVFPQITLVLFFVLLSLYMSNISSMMCASLIILLVNNLFSQFFGNYISLIDFMYYLYAFSGYNGMELTGKMIVSGVLVNIITEMILVYGIRRRTNRMTL